MKRLTIKSLMSNNWCDSDELMLHACFQILKNCVEREHVDTHCNYEANKEFVDEVRFLYKWWNNRIEKEMTDEQIKEDNEMLIRLMKIRTQLWT